MIRHVAVFRFSADFTGARRAEWVALLLSMEGVVPGLRAVTVGDDIRHGPASYDLAIVADFDDLAALAQYEDHPIHREVLRLSAPVKTALATVDFDVADG